MPGFHAIASLPIASVSTFFDSVGAATGAGAANADGVRARQAVGASVGSGIAVAAGASTLPADGAATGTGAADAVGVGAQLIAGSATGAGAAAGVGASAFIASGAATGTGMCSAASMLGGSPAIGSAAGSSAANAESEYLTGIFATASGIGLALAVSASTVASVGQAIGTGSATTLPPAPESLKLCQLHDLRIRPVSDTLVMEPEVGEPMTRKMYTGNFEDVQGTLRMIPRAQAIAIKDFWRDTLHDGSRMFTGEHPLTLDADVFIFLEQPGFSRKGHLYDVSILVRRIDA